MNKDIEEITAVETQPSVQLIISDAGEIVGGWGTASRALATLLEFLSGLDDVPLQKARSNFLSAGQSCYTTTSAFLSSIRGSLYFIPWSIWKDADVFETLIPPHATITFIVSY